MPVDVMMSQEHVRSGLKSLVYRAPCTREELRCDREFKSSIRIRVGRCFSMDSFTVYCY